MSAELKKEEEGQGIWEMVEEGRRHWQCQPVAVGTIGLGALVNCKPSFSFDSAAKCEPSSNDECTACVCV